MHDAHSITMAHGRRWHGAYGCIPCPVCQPEKRPDQDALTLRDGADRLLLHCKKTGCAFTEILAALGLHPGDWSPPDPFEAERRRRDAERRAEAKTMRARRIWADAFPASGSFAEAYLRARAITAPLPPTLRFAPACAHMSGPSAPAMLARVDGAEGFAIHRTWLSPDRPAKAALSPAKAMLGATRGGAVRLSDGPGPLVVAEGIETGLALLSGLLTEPSRVWAALSASGMRGLRLPPAPGVLIVAADGDAPGREAANDLALRAMAQGWEARLMPAPDGLDWADVLTGKGGRADG